MAKSTEATMVIDPVCGMEVGDDSDYFTEYKGHVYYFCSLEDKKEFEQHPDDYLLKSKMAPDEEEGLGEFDEKPGQARSITENAPARNHPKTGEKPGE